MWCSTQGHFGVRGSVAGVLGMDVSKLKVIPSEIGGGFGGKLTLYLEPLAVVMSQQSGRPVKMVMTREEVFRASGPVSATRSRVKIGAKRDGTLTAMQAELWYEAGAYRGGGPMRPGCMCIFAGYTCPNFLIEGYTVVVNKPKVAAYRAPGSPQSNFAGESTLDELARQLGMDPIELRLKNAVSEGSQSTYGPRFSKVGLRECLEAAKRHPNYAAELGENEGRGVAVGFWFNGGNQSSAEVLVNENGTVTVVEGNPDIGGSRASMALQCAETLGIPYEDIQVVVADTESVGFSNATGGSRTTFATGMAVIEASRKIIAELRERAAATWDGRCRSGRLGRGPGGAEAGCQCRCGAAIVARNRRRRGANRGADQCGGVPERAGSGTGVRGERRGRQDRSGYRQDGRAAVHGCSGCGQGRASELRRGTDARAGRGPGHRLGAERGVHLGFRGQARTTPGSSTIASRSRPTCR